MKKMTRYFSLFFLAVLFSFALPLHAAEDTAPAVPSLQETDGEPCMEPMPPDGIDTYMVTDFITESTNYYLAEVTGGYMLSAPSSSSVTASRYSSSASNTMREWQIIPRQNGEFTIHPVNYPAFCLSVNETNGQLILSFYQDFSHQKWYYSSFNQAINYSYVHSDWYGMSISYNGTNWVVADTYTPPIGLLESENFTPISSLSCSDIFMTPDAPVNMDVSITPANASYGVEWFEWRYTESVVRIFQGNVTPVAQGTCLVGFIDKITNVRGMCRITVTGIANGTYYIQNGGSDGFIQKASSNAPTITQQDLARENLSRWTVTLNTSTGYYTIKTQSQPSYFLSYQGTSGGVNAVSSGTPTNTTFQWKIISIADGRYQIVPMQGESADLTLTAQATGSTVVPAVYADDANYLDEWNFIQILPTSGGELAYNPSLWDNSIFDTSSYGYAIHNQVTEPFGTVVYEGQIVGQFASTHSQQGGNPLPEPEPEPEPSITYPEVFTLMEDDFDMYSTLSGQSLTFLRIMKYSPCLPNTYKVAFVQSKNTGDADPLFLRQDQDGFWSYLLRDEIHDTDSMGNLIFDPERMVMGYEFDVYYCCISPWNNIKAENETEAEIDPNNSPSNPDNTLSSNDSTSSATDQMINTDTDSMTNESADLPLETVDENMTSQEPPAA